MPKHLGPLLASILSEHQSVLEKGALLIVDEAKARVDSLTDAEALMLSKHVDDMPAGGSAVGIIVGAILLVFIILLITDLVGLTNVFPFVKKHR